MNIGLVLDVDGVLNIHSESYKTLDVRWNKDIASMEFHLVQRLNYLIDKLKVDNNVSILLCTGWLKDDFIEVSKKNKFRYNNLINFHTSFKTYKARATLNTINCSKDGDLSKYDLVIYLEDEITKTETFTINNVKCIAYNVDMSMGLSDKIVKTVLNDVNKFQGVINAEKD